MTIPPGARDAAFEAWRRWSNPAFPPALDAALTAAEPFIRAAVFEECATIIDRFGDEIQMQGTIGRLAKMIRALAKEP